MSRIRFQDKIVVWPRALRALAGEPGPVGLRARIGIMELGKISLRQVKVFLVRRRDDGSWVGGRALVLWQARSEESAKADGLTWDPEPSALAKLEALFEDGRQIELGWISAGRWCIGQNKKDLREAVEAGIWKD